MICQSIIAPRGIVTGFSSMHAPVAVEVVQDPYPKPQVGIIAKLVGDTYYVQVGDKRVPVAAALVLSDAAEPLDPRNQQLRILRADVRINRKGDMELIPEQGHSDSVLLLIDVSSGYCGGVAYDCSNGFQVIERGFQNYRLFQGEEQVLLAVLERGQTITATRSDKRYIWFGATQVAETLTFTLDPDLHCTLVSDKSGTQRVF